MALVHCEVAKLSDKAITGFAARVLDAGGNARRVVLAAACSEAVRLHWGLVSRVGGPWQLPPQGWTSSSPRDSQSGGDTALVTDFEDADAEGVRLLELVLPDAARKSMAFVLRTQTDRFVKLGGRDMFLPLSHETAKDMQASDGEGNHEAKEKNRKHSENGGRDEPEEEPLERVVRKEWDLDALRFDAGKLPDGGSFDAGLADEVSHGEEGCQRSLMHRYNFAAERLGRAAAAGHDGLVVMFTWFRFMAMRQLVINRNYNIKPREISAAQEKVTMQLAEIHRSRPELWEITRLTMVTIGRGGAGNIGQRIRDEILDVQQRNNCKGGMMEEWHQKLHNNTCPDDVVICEALIEYIESGLDISVYWARLAKDRVTKDRLASYDRKITSEPHFGKEQCVGLLRDLRAYLKTLRAVHSGADLDSAANAVLGYSQDSCQGKSVQVSPVAEVASDRLHGLLVRARCAAEVTRSQGDPLLALEPMIEARWELRPWVVPGGRDVGNRLRDVIYLDLSLESAIRTMIEGCLAHLGSCEPADVMLIVGVALENVTMSAGGNSELLLCLKEWRLVAKAALESNGDWALRAKAAMDRIRRELADQSEHCSRCLQTPAAELGKRLRIDGHILRIFAEEVVRGGSAAPLSQLLRALDPILRKVANLGSWQIISPVEACGRVACVEALSSVQYAVYSEATVLVAQKVGGDEEIPDGVVALITMDMPDVLSHVAVRARNEKCFFAAVFDAAKFEEICGLEGVYVKCKPSPGGDEAAVERVTGDVQGATTSNGAAHVVAKPSGSLALKRVDFGGEFALASSAFSLKVAGGKSCNLNGLRGRLPDWVKLPASVVIPFGGFDAALKQPENAAGARQIQALLAELRGSQDPQAEAKLAAIRQAVQALKPPQALLSALRVAFKAEGLPWQGEPGESQSGTAAWLAITGVWASKWNDRAYISCGKTGLDHSSISMAVLCQQVVQARYAFVIHTTNPSTGNADELYAEVVCGLGETLVGNYSGRALGFTAPKGDLSQVQVKSFPSKSVGLYVEKPTLIFRSDSNAEDLEGYAGAGLYDSIIMEASTHKPIDYSSDPLVSDPGFRAELLHRIADVGCHIEKVLGSAQDIEGAVDADGSIYVVQTRPQV